MKRPSPRAMQASCEAFNAKHPVGSEVLFFTGLIGENGKIGTVRAPAEILSGHTPVAWIEGARSCVALTHVRPVPERVS
jgi:hypothetical protein